MPQLIPPRVPITDPRTGLMAQTWYRFFNSWFAQTGGYDGVVPAASGGTGISSYTSGDIIYASAATTLAKLSDVSTGNALISGGVLVPPSWGKIGLTTHVSGTLAVGNGGTGITSGTSGGVPYFSGSSSMASSGALSLNRIVLGGGSGAGPSTPLGIGTSTQVLHGNAGGAPTWGSVSLTTDVSGTLQAAQVPAFIGDVTSLGGSLTLTLATVAIAGTNTKITYNAKGLVTSGSQAAASDLSNGTTGSGALVLANTPTLITPNIGAATGSSLNLGSGALTAGATSVTTLSASGDFTCSSSGNTVKGSYIRNSDTGANAYTVQYFGDGVSATTALFALIGSGNSAYGGARSLLIGTNVNTPIVMTVNNSEVTRHTSAGLQITGALKVSSLGAFSAGDKYVIADASGNFHISSLGPAS